MQHMLLPGINRCATPSSHVHIHQPALPNACKGIRALHARHACILGSCTHQHGLARADQAVFFGGIDHGECYAVLDRGAWLHQLQLSSDARIAVPGDMIQEDLHTRRASSGVQRKVQSCQSRAMRPTGGRVHAAGRRHSACVGYFDPITGAKLPGGWAGSLHCPSIDSTTVHQPNNCNKC